MKLSFTPALTIKFLLSVTLISVGVQGYVFSTGDQSTYVPQVLRRVNPALFSKDYLATTAEGDLSFMFPLMAGVIKITGIDIEWLYFCLYLIFRVLILILIYKLSQSLLATIILSLPKFVAGTNQTTIDNAFLPRFFVLPLLLLNLHLICKNRFVLAAFLTGVIFSFHPYSGVYLGLFLFACLFSFRQSLPVWAKTVIAGLLGSSWFLISSLPQYLGRNSALIMNPNWLNIVSSRLPYNLLSNWPLFAWLALLIPVIGIYLYPNRLAVTSVVTAVIVTLVHFVFGEIFRVALIFQLQLPRIWLIPTILGYIAWAKILSRRLIFIPMTLLLIFNFGKFKPTSIEWPHKYSREWDQVQVWVRQNTPADALFITPATRIGFRIRSQRSIVAEIKDGSSGLYSYELARTWQERINDLGYINHKTTTEIQALQAKYSADYLVTFSDAIYKDFTPLFRTPTFIIYKL